MYILKSKRTGRYFWRLNFRYSIAQWVDEPGRAQCWATRQAAQTMIDNWGGTGYGLVAEDLEIMLLLGQGEEV